MKSILIVILCLISLTFCQTEKHPNLTKTCDWPDAPHYKNTYTLGLGAGLTQGTGIHLRKWFDKHGFNITLLPFIKVSDQTKDLNLDFGINYMFAIWEGPMYEFFRSPSRNLVYAYVGGHYNYIYYDTPDTYMESNSEEKNAFLGGGLGLQMNVGSILVSTGIGYVFSRQDFNDYTSSPYYYYEDELSYSLMPSFEFSLGYTFGWK